MNINATRIAATLFFVLLTSLFVHATPDIGSEADELLQLIQELDQRIQRQIVVAQLNIDLGKLNQKILEEKELWFSFKLDAYERTLYGFSTEDRERLLPKLLAARDTLAIFSQLAADGTLPNELASKSTETEPQKIATTQTGPVNDGCENASPMSIGDVLVGDTSTASNDGVGSCGSSLFTPDVWFLFSPTVTELVYIDTEGSTYDTVLSIHSSCPGTADNEIACNDDSIGLQAGISVFVTAGTEYLIRLSGMNGAVGPYQIQIASESSIEGRVTTEGPETAIKNCSVRARDEEGITRGFDRTDGFGYFSIPRLAAGTYNLSAGCSGYQHEVWDDIPCILFDTCSSIVGDPVVVPPSATVSGIDFSLNALGRIEGTLRDALTGDPLPSVRVRLWADDGSYSTYATSKSAGTYAIAGRLPGTYFLTAAHGHYADELYDGLPCPGGTTDGCDPTTGTPVLVEFDTITGGIDFGLQPKARISGIVTEEGSTNPVSYPRVQLWDSTGEHLGYAQAPSDGSFTIGGLIPGAYLLTASDSDYVGEVYDNITCDINCDPTIGTPLVITAPQQHLTGIDFELIPRARIEGTVTDAISGTGLDTSVIVFSQFGSVADYAHCDASGYYLSDPLHEGTHFARASEYDYVSEVYDDIPCPEELCDPTDGTAIDVVHGPPTSDINFALTPFGQITGHVFHDGTGDPIEGINVAASDGSGQNYGYSTTAFDGSFSITGLPTDTYFVATRDSTGTIVDELFDNLSCPGGTGTGCVLTSGNPVEVTNGAVIPNIDFHVLRASAVAGTVIEASTGSPLDGIEVTIFDSGGNELASATSSTDGSYTVRGLWPGTYYAVAGKSYSKYVFTVFDGIQCTKNYPKYCDLSTATPIVVLSEEVTSGVNFALHRYGSITGTVVREDTGSGIPYFDLNAYTATGSSVESANSSSSGYFVFDELPPGDYYIMTTEYSSSFINELFDDVRCTNRNFSSCNSALGTLVSVGFDDVVEDIDFRLTRKSRITGLVVDALTGTPLSSVNVELWNDTGRVMYTRTDNDGFYTLETVAGGTYFVATAKWYGSSGYLDELYDDIPCPEGPPQGCTPTKGEPIVVAEPPGVTRFIDFELMPFASSQTGLEGRVVRAATGEVLPGITIDIFDSVSGVRLHTVRTETDGSYFLNLPEGTYLVATDNTGDFQNQIWDGLLCPVGSAFEGTCDVFLGQSVNVVQDQVTTGIDFALHLSGHLFYDGFENGGTDAWDKKSP